MMEILGWTRNTAGQDPAALFTPIKLCPICCRWNLIKIPSRLDGGISRVFTYQSVAVKLISRFSLIGDIFSLPGAPWWEVGEREPR